MDLFIIPRRVARLQYLTARLPFTVLDKYVMARYWDDRALPRQGFGLFLGSMDEIAGWLLADDRLSRRGQALMRRPESQATASEPEATVPARWAQYEEDLQAAQAAALQAGRQAHEGINIAAADQQGHQDGQQARRKAEAQAVQIPIPAGQDQAGAASQQRPDAADHRRLVRYRPGEPPAPASSP